MTSIFTFPASQAEEINVAVTGNTAKTIADATDNTLYVAWFEVNGHTTSTPALTVDIYDGTNARYLSDDYLNVVWNARTAGAKSGYPFTKGYVIPKGSLLRVTSDDAAGKFHVHGVLYRQT